MYLFKICLLFILLSGVLAEAQESSITCSNNGRGEVSISEYQGPLLISSDRQRLAVRFGASRFLEYNISTQQPRAYRSSPHYGEVPTALTQQDRAILAAIDSHQGGAKGLAKQCRPPTDDEIRMTQLNSPWKPKEKETCSRLVRKVQQIRNCPEAGNCQQIYQNYYRHGRPTKSPSFSAQHFLQTGRGTVGPLAKASALGYTADAVAFGMVGFRKKIIPLVGRGGLSLAVGGSVAVSWLTVPITGLWLYLTNESCNPGLYDTANDSLENCIAKSPKTLVHRFSRDIEQAINSPDPFIRSLENPTNMLATRLACAVIEEFSNRQDSLYGSITCQGRTLSISHDNYLIHPEGYLYRHHGMVNTYSFGRNGQSFEAETRSVPPNPVPVTSYVREEARRLQILAPRINEVFKTCSELPGGALEMNFKSPTTR